jgi:HEPN domain-containing protein
VKIEEHIGFWLEGAEHDLATAESLFAAEKFDWCLFLGHLALEKTLKAMYVRYNNNQMPPRTHSLVKLAEKTTLPLTEEQKLFLDEVTDFNLEVRYPEYKNEFRQKCTKVFCGERFNRIKEYYKWLKSQLESGRS